ncbi:UNVERIFIED_CONTAM: atpI [Trichonephila clavipes]|jgi:ATP synthase protein I|uniref:ATP synthase protein I n=3 Tax=Pseudomonadaceae TaxID=135621 RepID=A0A653B484_ECTOL|nr:F0F1 ATP synthase subunit I [Pseudomonas sp. THAF187a]QFT44941.1 F0F1 ATP synthase subunit I [Pseudomonas sp. THAF42]TNF15828.1 MAG: F0F1 ATP synthase subunit I [Pseudomonadales bacterium]WFC60343.1 F0F1 ATP synthase subunit I [Pseudomonas sp. REST10]CAE6966524.1 ATP synthase protein I [Pseudomonas oleovorans]|tara:strand:+ start:4167 stop:4571 length:405 start_codon:yes stop_codon:yes gene_type:complete
MERRMPKRLPFHRLPVFPVLMAQLVVLLLAATLTWQWRGNVAGYSALLGGMIAWLPNLYFAHKAFRYSGARAAREIVRSFYAGEAGKLILTFVLFALTFAGVKPLEAPMLFGVYLLTLMVSWFAPLLITKFSRP